MPELEINQETVCFLCDRARLFHCKEEVVIPEVPGSPSDDWARQVLADHASDTTYQEFKVTIDDLEPDQQQAVVALMWLGRGDYSLDEWQTALDEAADSWNEFTAEYLIAHPLLADYLDEGLAAFGYSCNP